MNEREALIRLNAVRGLGSATIHRFLKAFGTAQEALGAPEPAVKQALGRWATEEVLRGLRESRPADAETEERLAEAAGARILTLEEADYPKRLKEIADPPPVLYVKGTLVPEDSAAIAMVGTRRASDYGLEQARRIAQELAASGITVVSGLAEGIDGAAHQGALEAGGRTIAVVGHGLSSLFPAMHRELAERVGASGCLLSEFPMGMPPEAMNFPRRNRVIAGLTLGVVVVEAPERSGALITAREAMEQGREVFAVPGPVGFGNRGAHALLRDGAKLVESARDILEEVAPQLLDIVRLSTAHTELADVFPSDLSPEEQQVLKAVPVGAAAGFDRLAGRTALAPNRLLSVLTGLELKGLVRQKAGQGFSRKK